MRRSNKDIEKYISEHPTKMTPILHTLTEDCWCDPYPVGDGVWGHRTFKEYLDYRVQLILDYIKKVVASL